MNPTHTFANPNLTLQCSTDEKALVASFPSGRERAIVTAEVNDITGGIEYSGHNGFSAAGTVAVFAQGADDQIKLNAALLFAKTVHVYGMVVLSPSSSVILNSGNRLVFMPGSGIKVPDGATNSTYLITNRAAITVQRTIADGAITSAANTLTGASISAADVGRSVIISGAGTSGLQLCATVLTASPGTATLDASAATTVSGATVRFYDTDTDIEIHGGVFDRASATGNGIDAYGYQTTLHTAYFRRFNGLRMFNPTLLSTGACKYAISAGQFTNFLLENPYYNTSSDGCHLHGPFNGAKISGSRGYTGDDPFSVTLTDYTAYNDVQGDGYDVEVVDTNMSNHGGRILFVGGVGCKLRNVAVTKTRGRLNNGGVTVSDGTEVGFPFVFVTDIDNVLIRDHCPTMQLTHHGVSVNATGVGAMTIDDHRWDMGASTGSNVRIDGTIELLSIVNATKPKSNTSNSQYGLFVGAAAVINTLRINGLDVRNAAGAYMVAANIQISGYVKNMQMSNYSCVNDTYTGSGNNMIQVNSGGKIDYLSVNGTLEVNAKHGILAAAGATLGPIVYTGYNRSGCVRIGEFNVAANINIGPGKNTGQQGEAIRALNGAAVTVTGSGCAMDTNSYDGISRAGAEVVRVINQDFPADTAKLTPQAGDRCWNRNVASPPLIVGPCIYNGTVWKSLLSLP